MLRRLAWLLFRRYWYMFRYKGFRSSFLSFVCKKTVLTEYNRLYGRARIFNSTLGRFTYANSAYIQNTKIGAFCSIGPQAIIGGLGNHPTEWASTHPAFYSIRGQAGLSFSDKNYFKEYTSVSVGNDVWIGARATILDGVTIGDGAIIAMGAVVVKDVAPYSIVGGVPAKLIRYRFEPGTIKKLLRLKWWDWPEEELRKKAPLFREKPSAKLLKLPS